MASYSAWNDMARLTGGPKMQMAAKPLLTQAPPSPFALPPMQFGTPGVMPYALPGDYNALAGTGIGDRPSVPAMPYAPIIDAAPASSGASQGGGGGAGFSTPPREEQKSDLELLYEEMRAKGYSMAEAKRLGVKGMQERLGQTLDTPLGYDLSPLNNLVNQWSGSRLGAGYAPETVDQRKNEIAQLEAGITSGRNAANETEYSALKDNAAGLFNIEKMQNDQDESRQRLAVMREQVAVDRQKIAALAAKDPTIKENQWNAAGFGRRMDDSNKAMESLLADPAAQKALTSGRARISGMGPSKFQTPVERQFDLHKQDFILAFLRDESGASIGTDEYTKADRAYFPQWGDTKADIAAKAAKRARMVEARKNEAGGAWSKFSDIKDGKPAAGGGKRDITQLSDEEFAALMGG